MPCALMRVLRVFCAQDVALVSVHVDASNAGQHPQANSDTLLKGPVAMKAYWSRMPRIIRSCSEARIKS
eukprot:15454113-Alexandrium_andersonii.AAC.1